MEFSALPGPQAYERYYVRRLCEPWGRLLLDRLSLKPGERLLDIGTGPGTVARLAAERLGVQGRVVGIDISDPMLDIARSKPTAQGAPIHYVNASAASLPFENASFDVVTCLQVFQFLPDRAASLAEVRRILAPGARLGITYWAPIATCDHFAAIDAAIDDAGLPSAWHEGMRTPFTGPTANELARLLEQASFTAIYIDRPTLPLIFAGGPDECVQSIAATPLAGLLDAETRQRRGGFLQAFRQRLARFEGASGVVTTMTAVTAVATAAPMGPG